MDREQELYEMLSPKLIRCPRDSASGLRTMIHIAVENDPTISAHEIVAMWRQAEADYAAEREIE